MIMRSIPSPAMVVACLALFVALGGTGYAASQLAAGEGQATASKKAKIKRGPPGQRGKQGRPGKQGATGLQGPIGKTGSVGLRGVQGPRGPSDGRVSIASENFVLVGKSEAEATVVASLTLPPGKWLLTGQATLTNLSGADRSAWCSLDSEAGELVIDRVLDEAPATQKNGDATLLAGVDLSAGGVIDLFCWAEAVPSGDGTEVYKPQGSQAAIQAVQVETLEVE